jgi:hypothetical protein
MLALLIRKGAFNSALFNDFIRTLLTLMQPFPAANSVIVMDNCAIHKDPAILQEIEAAYVVSSENCSFRSIV